MPGEYNFPLGSHLKEFSNTKAIFVYGKHKFIETFTSIRKITIEIQHL